MKRVVLVHGWEGSPTEGWKPWLQEELEDKKIDVLNPQMPNTNYPKQSEWIKYLSEITGTPDSQTILVGHSLGGITILRYLEQLEDAQKIGAAVLVAGFTDDLHIPEISDFFNEKIQWGKIKKHCDNFYAINSDNDRYVSLSYGAIFKEKLGAQLIQMHNMHHFSGSEGITKIPLLLELILNHFSNSH